MGHVAAETQLLVGVSNTEWEFTGWAVEKVNGEEQSQSWGDTQELGVSVEHGVGLGLATRTWRVWVRCNRKSVWREPVGHATMMTQTDSGLLFYARMQLPFSISLPWVTGINNPVFLPLGQPTNERSILVHFFLLRLFPAYLSGLPVHS